MALSIGQLNLQLVGDSAGLRKILPDMNRLGTLIDKLGRSQEQGSVRAVSALNKQEAAIRRQITAVQNLNATIKRAKGPGELAGANVRALQAFVRATTKGTVSTTEFNRANDKLSATLARSSRKLKAFQSQAKTARLSKMATTLRDLESASVLAIGPLSGLGARIRAIGSIAGRSALKTAAWFGVITGGIVAISKLASASIKTSLAMDAINARLVVVTGSTALANANFQFASDTAEKMGLNILITADAFSQLSAATKGTSAAGVTTRRVFEGLSAAGAALRLTNEQITGAFRAVQQIASKGRVQAEELIGQLAERVPNAIQLAADAFGVNQAALLSMVQKGLVPATEFLGKFGDKLIEVFGPAASRNINTLQGAINELSNASFNFKKAFEENTGVAFGFNTVIQATTKVVNFFARNMKFLISIIGVVTGGLLGLVSGKILKGFVLLTRAIVAFRTAIVAAGIATAFLTGGISLIVQFAGVLIGAIAGAIGFNIAFTKSTEAIKKLNSELSNTTDTLDKRYRKGLLEVINTQQKAVKSLFVLKNNLSISSEGAIKAATKFNLLSRFVIGASNDTKKMSLTLRTLIRKIQQLNDTELEVQSITKFKQELKDLNTQNDLFENVLLGLQGQLILTNKEFITTATKLGLLDAFFKQDAKSISDFDVDTQKLLRTFERFMALKIEITGLEKSQKQIADVDTALKNAKDTLVLQNAGLILNNSTVISLAQKYGILRKFIDTNTVSIEKLDKQTGGLFSKLLELARVLNLIGENNTTEKTLTTLQKKLQNLNDSVLISQSKFLGFQTSTLQAAKGAGVLTQFIDTARGKTVLLTAEQQKFINVLLEMDDIARRATGLQKLNNIITRFETPLQKLTSQFKEIAALRKLATETFSGPELARAQNAITLFGKSLNNNKRLAFEFGDAFSSAFEDAIIQGEGLRKVLQGLADDFLRIALRQTITAPLGKAFAGFISGGFLGFAHGGRPPKNKVSIVGENGPEFFKPDSAGTVIPNNKLKSALNTGINSGGNNINSTNINVTINQNVAFPIDTKNDMRAQILQALGPIREITVQAVQELVRREGLQGLAF